MPGHGRKIDYAQRRSSILIGHGVDMEIHIGLDRRHHSVQALRDRRRLSHLQNLATHTYVSSISDVESIHERVQREFKSRGGLDSPAKPHDVFRQKDRSLNDKVKSCEFRCSLIDVTKSEVK